MFKRLWGTPFHPVSCAAYFVLALLAGNLAQVDPAVVWRPLLLSITAALLVDLALWAVLKDPRKAALIASLALVLFFTYGHVYKLLETSRFLGFSLGRHRILGPLWLALFCLAAVWILKKSADLRSLTQALNLASIVLLVFPLSQMAASWIRSAPESGAAALQPASALVAPGRQDLPDIYYIVLDMYARQDVLKKIYDYDNQPFLGQLRSMGFFVADCSLSNYNHTELSLASELNYDYTQELLKGMDPQSTDQSPTWPLIQHSLVRSQLEATGYRTIAFETGYPWSQMEDASSYYRPETGSWALSRINPFEALLIENSAGLILTDSQALLSKKLYQSANYLHINRELFVLSKLEDIPSLSGPKFIFVHILIPHPPFVFAPDGSIQTDTGFYGAGWGLAVDNAHEIQGYRDQIAFINNRMLPLLKNIITRSKIPPVILLQGDHGVAPYRNAPLNAIYLPGGSSDLYPSISLVNSFRVILNTYFGQKLSLLPDQSYSSPFTYLYDYSPYSEKMPDCKP